VKLFGWGVFALKRICAHYKKEARIKKQMIFSGNIRGDLMDLFKRRKGGAYTIEVALFVLFIIVVVLTMSPELKQTALDVIVIAKGSTP